MKKIILFSSAIVLLASCTYEKGEVPAMAAAELPCDSTISYSVDIVPIVTTNCTGCHDGLGSGPGDYNSYGDLKLAADAGTLKAQVYTSHNMPQGATISDGERHIIKCWADQGAPNN